METAGELRSSWTSLSLILTLRPLKSVFVFQPLQGRAVYNQHKGIHRGNHAKHFLFCAHCKYLFDSVHAPIFFTLFFLKYEML